MLRQTTRVTPDYPNYSSRAWYALSATFGLSSVLLFKFSKYLLTEVDYGNDGRLFVTNLVIFPGLALGCAACSCQFFGRGVRAAAAANVPEDVPQKNRTL